MAISTLTPTQRYAAGALLALAVRQAQIHQTHPLGSEEADDGAQDRNSSANSSSTGSDSTSTTAESNGDASRLWTHDYRGLLRPVFRFLDIHEKAWPGLEEIAASCTEKHHIGAYLRIIIENNKEESSESSDQKLALTKAVEAMVMS